MSRDRRYSGIFARLLTSAGVALVPMLVLLVLGLPAFGAVWIVLIALFVYSRLSNGAVLFSDWSWLRFLLTVGLGVGVPYVLLLLSAGF